MSKLKIIQKALQENPEVVIVRQHANKSDLISDSFIDVHDLNKTGVIYEPVQNFWIYVAPKNLVYKAEELNEFMSRLIPDIKPEKIKECRIVKPFGRFPKRILLECGELTYEEKIAQDKKYARCVRTLLDEDLELKGFVENQRFTEIEETADLFRRIQLLIFPCESADTSQRAYYFDELEQYLKGEKNEFTRYVNKMQRKLLGKRKSE